VCGSTSPDPRSHSRAAGWGSTRSWPRRSGRRTTGPPSGRCAAPTGATCRPGEKKRILWIQMNGS
jgi:hypothetical protein